MQKVAQGEGQRADAAREYLLTTPPLTNYELIVWEAFGILDSERPSGMGFASIPFRAILAYADYCEMNRGEREAFVKEIVAMDRVLVDAHRTMEKAAAK